MVNMIWEDFTKENLKLPNWMKVFFPQTYSGPSWHGVKQRWETRARKKPEQANRHLVFRFATYGFQYKLCTNGLYYKPSEKCVSNICGRTIKYHATYCPPVPSFISLAHWYNRRLSSFVINFKSFVKVSKIINITTQGPYEWVVIIDLVIRILHMYINTY